MSLREAYWLAQERQRTEWDRTCSLIAAVLNLFAKRAVKPEEIHPMGPREVDV